MRRLARRYDRALRLRYGRSSARTGLELPRFAERAEVIDYATLEKRAAKAAGEGLPQLLAGLRADAAAAHGDERARALEIIRRLHGLLPPGRPLIVASLLPPFYPAQLAGKRTPATQAVEAFCARQELRHRRVYPYIADMSYFAFDTPGLEAYARASKKG